MKTKKLKVILRRFTFFIGQIERKNLIWLKSNSLRIVEKYKVYDFCSCGDSRLGICNDSEKCVLRYTDTNQIIDKMSLEDYIRKITNKIANDSLDYLFGLFFYGVDLNDILIDNDIYHEKEIEKNDNIIFDLNDSIKGYWQNGNFRFLIGSGLSLKESGYDSLNWDSLVAEMESALATKMPSLDINEVKNFFGNQYGIPQALKDNDEDIYWHKLLSSIYQNDLVFPSNESSNTTLKEIAKILNAQNNLIDRQFVGTFNYDDNLEKELSFLPDSDECPDYSSSTLFADEKVPNRFSCFNNSIIILHLHGYYPRSCLKSTNIDNRYKKSIILTDKDYDTGYSGSAYPVSALKYLLTQSCTIIGNSVSDYEERKRIMISFDENHIFHFLLKARPKNTEFATYFQKYMLSIGVFVIWFENNDQIREELQKIVKSLK